MLPLIITHLKLLEMAESYRFKRTVTGREEFTKAVDTGFKSFIDPTPEEDTDTVEELFRIYDKLYYEIPLTGTRNSHEYLIKESSKLVNIEQDNEDIQPLLQEITELRTRLLEANQTIIDLQVGNG